MKINKRLKDDLKNFLLDKIKQDNEKIRVFSAYELSDTEKNILKKKFSKFNWTDAEYIVNNNILAGIIIKKGSEIINMSLQEALSNLKKIVYENN